jgi:hypothetical protein
MDTQLVAASAWLWRGCSSCSSARQRAPRVVVDVVRGLSPRLGDLGVSASPKLRPEQ